jgi:hypothetical protein
MHGHFRRVAVTCVACWPRAPTPLSRWGPSEQFWTPVFGTGLLERAATDVSRRNGTVPAGESCGGGLAGGKRVVTREWDAIEIECVLDSQAVSL